MNKFFRAIIAGYGAKKLGGGCFGTIIVFIIIWVALGQCSFSSREVPPPETYPTKYRACSVVLPSARPMASSDWQAIALPACHVRRGSGSILPQMKGPADRQYIELSFFLAEPWEERLFG